MADNSSQSGIGVLGMLLVAFVVLKLTGVIGWSWWWVMSPVWIPCAILVLIIGGIFGVAMLWPSSKGRK